MTFVATMTGVSRLNNMKLILGTSIFRRSVSTHNLTETTHQELKPFSAIPTYKFSKFLKEAASLKNEPYAFHDYLFKTVFKSLAENEEGIAALSLGPLKPPTVIVSKPELIEKFMRDSGSSPSRHLFTGLNVKRRQEVDSGGYQSMGLLTSQGDEWQNLRQKVQQPMLRPQALQGYAPLMDNIAQDFIKLIKTKLDPETKQTPDDFMKDIALWALESVSYLTLDTRLGFLSPTTSHDSSQMQMVESAEIMLKELVVLDFDPGLFQYFPFMFKRYHSLSKATDTIDNLSRGYIHQAMEKYRNQTSNHEDSMLARFVKNGCTEDEATVMASELMLAGIDTTSRTMAWLLYQVATNEQVQESLLNEVEAILPDKESELDQAKLDKMKYHKAVMKESQRIMPVIPINARTLGPDYNIAGYDIDRPCWFISLHHSMCLSEEYFKDPLEFRPERWLRGHCLREDAKPYVWLPFGHGQRMCLGRRFAEQEIQILLCKMVQNFRLEWNQEKPLGYISGILNLPNLPVKLTLKPRD